MTHVRLLQPSTLLVACLMVAAAFAIVWWPRRRNRWAGGLLAFGLLASLGFGFWADYRWLPFGQPVGLVVWQWAAFAVAVVLAALTPHPKRLARRLLVDLLAVLLAAGGGLLAFNFHYMMFRSPADFFRAASGEELPAVAQTVRLQDRSPAAWRRPADLPSNGGVSTVLIPGEVSGFTTRPARVYLPPAYLVEPRPQLPVLILMAGQPGEPELWLNIGHVDEIMDAYAAAHDGLAPIVVMPDHLGSHMNNPLCSDAFLGKNATYLETDLVAWIKANLDVDPDTHHWAVAGLSNGGTCSTQLASRRPDLFTTFISISGELEPSLGDHARTIANGFGGDEAAFKANNPLDLMAATRYPDTLGVFTVGDKDAKFAAYAQQLSTAGTQAGMQTQILTVKGGHDWAAWIGGLKAGLPVILPRMGLPA